MIIDYKPIASFSSLLLWLPIILDDLPSSTGRLGRRLRWTNFFIQPRILEFNLQKHPRPDHSFPLSGENMNIVMSVHSKWFHTFIPIPPIPVDEALPFFTTIYLEKELLEPL